nr:protein anti-silencing 1 isoform X1 [Tanacetum cinerariifolium]
MDKTDITNKDDRNVSIVPVDKKVENKERSKTPTGSDRLPNQPFKKQKSDVKNPPMVDNKSKHEEKLPADVNNLKDLGTSGAAEEKLNQKNGKISSKVTDNSEGKIIQNSKDGGSAKLLDNKKLGNNGSGSAKLLGKAKSGLTLDSTANNKEFNEGQSSEGKIIKSSKDDGSAKRPDNNQLGSSGSGKDLVASSSLPKEKSKSGLALDYTKESKEQTHENKRRLTKNKSFKAPALSTDRDKKLAYQEFVCGQKPNDVNDDTSKWFRPLPWDKRLKNAYDQGMAILLHNVDPDYTSSKIKDIVWHTFNKKCAAKIVQRTALSSPHYGQAINLLNKKEATQKILVKLDEVCLMLSNGRPPVATSCPPISTKKNSRFFGHLTLNKIKLQNQRNVEDAVSTSHFSQQNIIVYDMAMDWCLLQSRSKK